MTQHNAKACINCHRLAPRSTKIDWPEREVLLRMLDESNFSQVAEKLGVTGNTVRKHLGMKPRGYRQPKQACLRCGGARSSQSRSGFCKECFVHPTKIDWPDNDELLRMISVSNTARVAKQLGVTDGAIRYHMKHLAKVAA